MWRGLLFIHSYFFDVKARGEDNALRTVQRLYSNPDGGSHDQTI